VTLNDSYDHKMTLLAVIVMESLCEQYVTILHSLVSTLVVVPSERKIVKNGNGIYKRDAASLGAVEHIRTKGHAKNGKKD
jgi:hypothetical protein